MKIIKKIAVVIGIFLSLILAFALYMKYKTIPVDNGSLEERYSKKRTYEVKIHVINDSNGKPEFILYMPNDISEPVPAILWGNGTDALPENYDGIMSHLASWGFVVIDTYSRSTGTGEPLINALHYLMEENEKTDGELYNKIDMDRIGAVGHSQGATGAINCHTNFEEGRYIKTVISVALPALKWCDKEDVYDTSKMTVPFLVLSGTMDFIVAPISSCNMAVMATSEGADAGFVMAKGAGHNEIQTDGGKYRGIITAWLRYQLVQDQEAYPIFRGQFPEIYTNSGWKKAYLKSHEID